MASFRRDKLESDLEANWAVVGEAVQTILRREVITFVSFLSSLSSKFQYFFRVFCKGVSQPYEMLKALTRTGRPISKEAMEVKMEMKEERIGKRKVVHKSSSGIH